MDDRAASVSGLVARFQLRRQASTEAFRTGVRLAPSGLVTLAEITEDEVCAGVRDPQPLSVELYIEHGSLLVAAPAPQRRTASARIKWPSRISYGCTTGVTHCAQPRCTHRERDDPS